MELVDNGISFVVEGVEGVEEDKALEFNKGAFAIACFCFTSNSFSLFCSHYFLSASSVNR